MSKVPLQKHTLHLRKGDWEYLQSVYGHIDRPVSSVVRQIVSTFVDNLKAAEEGVDEQLENGDDIKVNL